MLALLFLRKLAGKNWQYLPTAAEYDINTWHGGGVLDKAVQCPILLVKVQSITL